MICQVMPAHEAFQFIDSLSAEITKALPKPWHGTLIRMDGLVVIIEEWGYLTGKMLVSVWNATEYDCDDNDGYCDTCEYPKPDCECVLVKGITHV